MKKVYRNILIAALLIMPVVFVLFGCYEPQYYHRYHHHTREWYGRRHMPPPDGVNFDRDRRGR